MPPPTQTPFDKDPGESQPRPGNPLFCHEEFLTELEATAGNNVGKRASLLLQRLLLDERREFFKSTQGVNRGWRRSRLGGNHGSHFYAWWAPRGAPPLASAEGGFDTAPEGSVFLRAIRHHDDHTPLDAQRFQQNYVPLTAGDVRDETVVPAPWTPQQAKFAQARQYVRTLRGYPGSGKTTALWHAAESAGYESILYVTYSRDLAILAEDYFTKLVMTHKKFRVVTFPEVLRLLASADETPEPARSARVRFVKEVGAVSPRILGPWIDARPALYDEMHAHLIGSCLPERIGRWNESAGRRMSARDYRALREKSIGRSAADAVCETAEAIEKRNGRPVEELFFPELALAAKGLERLRGPHSGWIENRGLLGFDCIALDEAQDLTPLEALLLIQLAIRNKPNPGSRIAFLAAGDEAQTVRPSDFEWGWFHDLLHEKLTSPTDFELRANLRSPQRIAEVVNRVWLLYGHISKQERPSGSAKADLDDEGGDQIVYCTTTPGEELDQLLRAFAEREGLAIVNLEETIPAWVPEDVRSHVVSSSDVKGLDFRAVCVLNGGAFLMKIADSDHRGSSISDLTKRLGIDQLRVAVSRPAERIYWLDVDPPGLALASSRRLLGDSALNPVYPVVPAVVLRSLEEEALSSEERIQLCLADARQFLSVKPEIAWSRVSQALNLLGGPGQEGAILDAALRRTTHLTVAEISFCLAFRKVTLSARLGVPDLWRAAATHASTGGGHKLAQMVTALKQAADLGREGRLDALRAVQALGELDSLEPWLRLELQPFAEEWAAGAEAELDDPEMADLLLDKIIGFYGLFDVPDREARIRASRIRAIEGALKGRFAGKAIGMAEATPNCDPALKARCLEAAGRMEEAAGLFAQIGDLKQALHCYRAIPDFEKALQIAAKLGNSPAAESLRWLDDMRKLAARRPADFNKVMLPEEKKLLEQILETSLGVTRRKPAVKKAAKKAAVKKAPQKAVAKPLPRFTVTPPYSKGRKPPNWQTPDDPF